MNVTQRPAGPPQCISCTGHFDPEKLTNGMCKTCQQKEANRRANMATQHRKPTPCNY